VGGQDQGVLHHHVEPLAGVHLGQLGEVELDRGGLWVTLPDPVTTPEQIAMILEYQNNSSLAKASGGRTSFVVRFYAAGIP
jgi:hypothetical protein